MQTAARHYLLIVGIAVAGLVLILRAGSHLPAPGASRSSRSTRARPSRVKTRLRPLLFSQAVGQRLEQYAADPLSRFFLQLFAVITVSYSFGWLFTRYGQPAVVGEMMAGVVLGPSLFGGSAPAAFQFVFAASSLEPLRLLSQVGVCLFMFAVGMEMDWAELRQKAFTAIFVSHASIAIPCSARRRAGVSFLRTAGPARRGLCRVRALRFDLDEHHRFPGVGSHPAGPRHPQDIVRPDCFRLRRRRGRDGVGVARARRRIRQVFGFCLPRHFASVSCWSLSRLMFLVIKPNLPRWFGEEALERPKPAKRAACDCHGDRPGILILHPAARYPRSFGAFVAGLIMPASWRFRAKLCVRLENISSVLLLPVFFASSGLRTEIGLLHGRTDWLICLLIIALATFGKLGGTSLAARLTGWDGVESLQLGALMNTRGLMELIALNLGYELHILSQRAFSMLVLMALVTTIMTGPLLTLFGSRRATVSPQRR